MISIRMNHAGSMTWNEFHSCPCCLLTEADQIITGIRREMDGKQFLIPCSYIEDSIVYRIGLETVRGKMLGNYIWEVNEKNYKCFQKNIKIAYGVYLKGPEGLSSKQMDNELFHFFSRLAKMDGWDEIYANHTFLLEGFTVTI